MTAATGLPGRPHDPRIRPHVGFAGSLSFTFFWAARAVMPPGWVRKAEKLDHSALWLVTKGTVRVPAPGGPADCGPGTLIVFPPGSSPEALNPGTEPAGRYALSFQMRLWGEVDFFRVYDVPRLRRMPHPEALAGPWEQLVSQLEGHDGAVTLAAEGWARVLVDRWLSELEESGELRRLAAADERLDAAVAAVEGDLRGDWTLARLAEIMHLSPVRVRQIFTRKVGAPPARYITLRRIAHARALLADTDLTSVEIAAACGFADPRHFSRVFHRLTGLRPTRYREQARLGRG